MWDCCNRMTVDRCDSRDAIQSVAVSVSHVSHHAMRPPFSTPTPTVRVYDHAVLLTQRSELIEIELS